MAIAVVLLALRDEARDAVLQEKSTPSPSVQQVDLTRAVELVRSGAITRITLSGNRVEMVDRLGGVLVAHTESDVSFVETLRAFGVTPEQMDEVAIDVRPESPWPDAGLLLGGGVVLLVAALLLYRPAVNWAAGRASATNFGKSSARKEPSGASGTGFDDVAGAEEAKQELREVVEFLRNPTRFAALGARVPRGILITGAPGTGKTLLARAAAGEAGVPFFSCGGSEFVEMFVGVGAARIRDLFQRAKKNAPCIVFIDEIDALGRKRNAHAGNEERDQTLNQILVELDGFDQSCNVVVMAATNRPDVLDPALLRPGRFDRRIVVECPSSRDRLAILRIHARGKPLAPDADLEGVAKQTAGFSGADLENVMNEAALLAARGQRSQISAPDLEEAVDRVLVGLARKSRVISERERWITAYHESGHALVAHILPGLDPVQRISIIPRGGTGGHTRLLPIEDRHLWSRSQLANGIAFALGGMAAEEMVFGEMTTGSASDLAEATCTARRMVCLFGMSQEFGPLVMTQGESDPWPQQFSNETAARAEGEIVKVLEQGRQRATEILSTNRSQLDLLARELFEQETLQGAELTALLEGHSTHHQDTKTPRINLVSS